MSRARTRRSLRTLITFVIFGLIGSTLLVSAIAYDFLRRATDDRIAHAERVQVLTADANDLLTALVNQEVGLRGYLATGERTFLEPLVLGEQQERIAGSELRAGAALLGDRRVLAALVDFDRAADEWHRTIVVPQMEERQNGPLLELRAALTTGKFSFDQVRATHEPLVATITENGAQATGNANARVRRIHATVSVAAVFVLVLAAIATRYVLRNIMRPLANLAQRAERQEAFAAPPEEEPIQEVHALATSLYQLDTTVREREKQLATAHDDEVALARFGKFAQQLSDEAELHEAFERVCARIAAPTTSCVMVRNASRNRLEVVRPAIAVEEQLRHPILSDPMKCRAVRTMREVSANADAPTVCRCELGVPQRGSHVCLPLLAAGELIGIVNLQSDEPDHFDGARIHAVQRYTGFVGGTLSSLRLIAATRDRALRDGLTGAHNRAFLGEYLRKTIASVRRRGTNLAVLMSDLDHFKQINDEHGHLAGDQAIVALARCLQQQTRTSDAVVRYGGEEFVILLLDVNLETATATAERIRSAVECTRVSFAGNDLGNILRASIGIALFPAHGADEQSLLAAADAALYCAKQQGRNRVAIAAV